MKQLEENRGVRLLHRSTRKLVLTDVGKTLYEQSAAIINALYETGRQLVGGSLEASSKIRVAAPADFFDFFQMGFVADFLARFPKVQMDFVLGDQRIDLIAEGVDLVFRAGALPDSSLVARKISIGHRILASSPAYLAAHGIPKDIKALGQHTCIHSPHLSGQSTWNMVGPEGAAQVGVTGRFCANTAQARMKAALAGLGLCFLPEPLLRQSLKSGHLIEVLHAYSQKNNDLFIVFPTRKQIPLAVSTFVDEAIVHLQEKLFE